MLRYICRRSRRLPPCRVNHDYVRRNISMNVMCGNVSAKHVIIVNHRLVQMRWMSFDQNRDVDENDDDGESTEVYSDGDESSGHRSDPSEGEEDGEHEQESDVDGNAGAMVPTGHVVNFKSIFVLPVADFPCMPGMLYHLELRDDVKLVTKLMNITRSKMPYVGMFYHRGTKDDEEKTVEGESDTGNKKENEESVGESDSRFTIGEPFLTTEPRQYVSIKSLDEVHQIGTYCTVENIIRDARRTDAPNLRHVVLRGHHRVRIIDGNKAEPLFLANVDHMMDPSLKQMSGSDAKTIHAACLEIIKKLRSITEKTPMMKDWIINVMSREANMIANPGPLGDTAAGMILSLRNKGNELQGVLDVVDITDGRLFKVLMLLDAELRNMKLQEDIRKEVEEQTKKTQTSYLLNEQLKAIKKMLGKTKDEKEEIIKKFRSRLVEKEVPEEISTVIEEEFDKLSMLEPQSPEFSVSRNYLDWLTVLPWGVYTEDVFDLNAAEEQLNKDHYGLQDVKSRVLEFIAVGNLLGNANHGKIICLIGPPGVGKTSIGRSIATTLNRKFFRFSVGGMHDVAEIKGHRRTYIGAMPGKFVQALKNTHSSNPVVLIDEIDKIGTHSFHGDPSSALLEALDPEQNSGFMDHYLDAPVDLSNVLFICTGNAENTIPGPLADRMEFIRIAGYVAHEKLHIAKQYLEPMARKTTGVSDEQADIATSAIERLVRSYCREAGVRNLQKHIEKVYRKIAFKLVKEKPTELPVVVNSENLNDFVGKPVFTSDRLHDKTPPGVVMGMAWSQMGGSTLYIESVVAEETGKEAGTMQVTGQLGDVMTESSSIALTVAKMELRKRGLEADFFSHRRVHMHVPEGSTPKDGPSAGIAMVTSLLSLAMDRSVKADLAMTGEVTLTSCVLPIGGVREKVVAATRSGVKHIILPAENAHDWDELSSEVTEGLTVHFVNKYSDVFDVAFGKVRKKRKPKKTTASTNDDEQQQS